MLETSRHNSPKLCALSSCTVQWLFVGSYLTTSAISSIPLLEEANSLLGRRDSKIFWRGWIVSGASMSPIVEKCKKTYNQLQIAQTSRSVADLWQKHKEMWRREAFSEETETMTAPEAQHLLSPDVRRSCIRASP